MHRLSVLDAGFLVAETRETPMHVGGLYLFTLPEGVDEQPYIQELLEGFRGCREYRRPFGHKLKISPLGPAAPTYWVPDEDLDPDYHVRHSALPQPGRYRELFTLCARLHQSLLDRHRPMWELHIIEGLPARQIALYVKMHHCGVDGVSGIRLAQSMLSPDPDLRRDYSPFSMEAHRASRRDRPEPAPPDDRELQTIAELLRENFGVSTHLFKALRRYARAALKPREGRLMTSWTPAPHTSFTSKVTGARRFVAQSYAFPRVRAVAKALDGTVNDVVLAMCGGALRRYLMAQGELPTAPLTAMTPVNLRTESNNPAGNAVGALTANLATHIADPQKRFELTRRSMDDGKRLLRSMSPREIELFTQLTSVPALLIGALGLGDRFPPFSTVVSNVPGFRQRMYWNGARLDGSYPLSVVYHGFALTFTLLSNADQLDFGIMACRRSVPRCQRLIDDLEVSLHELEEVAGIAEGAPA